MALPVIAGGAIHVAVIHARVCPALARIPLDGGAAIRRRRLFGDNKTLRGALVMVAATTAAALLQSAAAGSFEWARRLTAAEVSLARPVLWGLLLGVGYIVGELPNSFLKRQLDIEPGSPARGVLGPVFWLADQVDSLAGVLILVLAVWTPPFSIVAWLVAITLLVHPMVAGLMLVLGLKDRVG